jgi:hypothetical protein
MMEDMEDKAAFPSDRYGEIGMTLRDYFAAKAMQALLRSWTANRHDDGEWVGDALLARESYVIADAMLKARSE